MILRGNFSSEVLHMSTSISVFIPEKSEAPFRVVYLLHGLHGDQGTWLDNTMLPVYGKQYNVVFVMPEAGRSFYLNLKYGRKYFDYVSDELPRVCRKIFNISAAREDTAVMGCSMGGFGSLLLSLTRPERFGFCGAIAPACLFFKPMLDALREDPKPYIQTGSEAVEVVADMHAAYGEGLEHRKEYEMVDLAGKFSADMPKPKIFTTCGTEDKLRAENLRFRDFISKTDHDFTYEEWAGGHDWYFFDAALKKTLEFWLGVPEKTV